MILNSIIFHTPCLIEIREFYEGTLNLSIGTFFRDGVIISDHSETYVNYKIGGALLCFEIDGDRLDRGTVVFNVEDFAAFKSRLVSAGVKIVSDSASYFKIKDPDGRSLIIEPILAR